MIDEGGLSVVPVTSMTLQHAVSSARIPTGLEALDQMLDGRGYYRGSTVLLSGSAGTGKTSLAAHFANGACGRGERCLYFLFEESPQQMIRNMRSIGIDLQSHVDAGHLQLHADRPSRYGLETHLLALRRDVERFRPDVVVIDPMTNLLSVGTQTDVRAMLTRTIDYLKMRGITGVFTGLTQGSAETVASETMISSLMDTWILLTTEQADRRRHRWISVLKSRGMANSDETCEFRITGVGLEILRVAEGVRR